MLRHRWRIFQIGTNQSVVLEKLVAEGESGDPDWCVPTNLARAGFAFINVTKRGQGVVEMNSFHWLGPLLRTGSDYFHGVVVPQPRGVILLFHYPMKSSKLTLVGMGFALLLSFTASASAASGRDWSQWLSHYYQSPQPDQVVPAVFALSNSGYFETHGQPATAIGFLSAVFAQNPDKVDGWMVEFRRLPVAHQRLVASALWYSALPGSDRQLRALAQEVSPELRSQLNQLLAQPATPVKQTPVLSESSLNLQWGAFLASGDSEHIVNVLAALGSGKPGLSSAARYTLAEKAAAHQRVYEICQAQLAQQPADVREQMQTALADVKSQR